MDYGHDFVLFSVAVERDRQRALNSIMDYRDQGRPFETHNALSQSWQHLPYPISPVTWFHYYRQLETILPDNDRIIDIFVCGTVMTPFTIIFYEYVRLAVYRMAYRNTPDCVHRFIGRVRFRLLFMATTAIEGRIEFERFRVTTTFFFFQNLQLL